MIQTRLEQSVGYMELFTSLGAGAVVVWVVWKLSVQPMNYIDSEATVESVRRSHQWTDLFLTHLPVVFLLITVAGSIAFVVYQTRFA